MKVALGVKVYGEKWSKVAAHVPGRTGPQVRERFPFLSSFLDGFLLIYIYIYIFFLFLFTHEFLSPLFSDGSMF